MNTSITVAELCRKQALEVQLVDIRSPTEFAAGHIPGAANIPMDQIEARLQDLCPGVPVVLICQAGKRACLTADWLKPSGREIAVLEGGTNAWIQARLPIVACVPTRWSLERQLRLGAGLIVLTGAVLALTVNFAWLALSALVGLGLTFAGLTDICPMGMLLAKVPWNRNTSCQSNVPVVEPMHDSQ